MIAAQPFPENPAEFELFLAAFVRSAVELVEEMHHLLIALAGVNEAAHLVQVAVDSALEQLRRTMQAQALLLLAQHHDQLSLR